MDTEQKSLESALRVFASEGYAGATTHRITQEANVYEVTLFRKFQFPDGRGCRPYNMLHASGQNIAKVEDKKTR